MKKLIQKIFSIKNNNDKTHKVITIFGVKLKFKKSFKESLKDSPFGLIIDTTLLCNNNCSFCWRSNNKEYLIECNKKYDIKTMPFEIFKKIIDDACQYNSVKWFTCCGAMGEPMLNEQIEDFYEYAYNKKHFSSITINTNGLAINKTCCLNWQMSPVFGNIKSNTIKEMWQSKEKQFWNNKDRFNKLPCKNCSGAENKIKGKIRSKRIMFS